MGCVTPTDEPHRYRPPLSLPTCMMIGMAPAPTPQSTVEGFILRARRIMAHSLIREQAELMQQLHSGQVKVLVTKNLKTGEESHRVRIDYPPEEAMESLASRVRPLILRKEAIYYEKVLNALEEMVGSDRLNEEIDVPWWHQNWREVIEGSGDAQAYVVGTQSGSITDRKLMYAWIYGDVVHANAPRPKVIRDLSIDDRYQAAAPGIARICDRVIYTFIMIRDLVDKGLITVDPGVLTESVVVTTTSVDREVQVYVAEYDGTTPEIPTSPGVELDPARWRSVHEALTEAGIIETSEVEQMTADEAQGN